jgi:hypothetical protein
MFAAISIDSADPSVAVGSYGPDQYRGAHDVRITWHLRDGRKVTKSARVMIPEPTGRNEHLPVTMPLGAMARVGGRDRREGGDRVHGPVEAHALAVDP